MHFKEKFLITSGVSQYDRFFGRFCQHKRIIAVYDHHVLYPDASGSEHIFWLHRNDHPSFSTMSLLNERVGSSYLKTDPVAEAMSEIVVVACFLYEIPCCLVGFFCRMPLLTASALSCSLQTIRISFSSSSSGFPINMVLVISEQYPLYIAP